LIDEPTITLLAALYAELRDYEQRRAKAAALLAQDDSDYRRAVLAGWDHAIGVKQAQIERERARHASTV
jgi:hypothetical protein